MKLAQYLAEENISPAQFARDLDVSRSTVHKYLHDTQQPEPQMMKKIIALTKGRVTPNDFYALPKVRSRA